MSIPAQNRPVEDTPIENRIGAVFIPVSHIGRAIDWYSRLFDLPVAATSHGGRIYDIAMTGAVSLILDSHKPVANSSQPICFFWCHDIQAAYARLTQMGAPILGEVEDIGSVTTLTFQDPDGNLLMVCQRNR
jgi:predicted enzyme related to lactoylglutathione lyase